MSRAPRDRSAPLRRRQRMPTTNDALPQRASSLLSSRTSPATPWTLRPFPTYVSVARPAHIIYPKSAAFVHTCENGPCTYDRTVATAPVVFLELAGTARDLITSGEAAERWD